MSSSINAFALLLPHRSPLELMSSPSNWLSGFQKGADFSSRMVDYFESADGLRVHVEGVHSGHLPNGELSENNYAIAFEFVGDKVIRFNLFADFHGFRHHYQHSQEHGEGCSK